jgi:hypothetical protein
MMQNLVLELMERKLMTNPPFKRKTASDAPDCRSKGIRCQDDLQ